MKLASIIKDKRQELGLTMQELADKSGLSKGTISLLERGYNPQTKRGDLTPSFQTLEKLSEGLGFSLNELISLLDDDQKISLESQDDPYYLDPESEILAIEIHNDPNLRILMSTVRKVPPEDIEALIAIAKRLEGKEDD